MPGRNRPLGRTALPDDLSHPRRRTAALRRSGDRLDLPDLRDSLESAQLSRFRTIIYDYPGEHPDDGARLGGSRTTTWSTTCSD